MKKITVIVPMYNTEKHIKKCLKSIKNQTYKNIEVFVIDDGSTDNSGKLAKKFCEKYNNFNYIYKENGGVSSARNLGLSLASGEYISFLDSDDTINKRFLEELINNIKEYDSFAMVNRMYKIINLKKHKYPIKKESIGLLKSPSCCLKLFQKKYIDELNLKFENSSIGEDLEFTAKLLINNKNYTVVEKYLYNYYIHEKSATHKYDEHLFSLLDAIDRIETYAKTRKYKDTDILEYMNISHILIGLMKRVKNIKDFNDTTIDKLINYVEKKYPNWENNRHLEEELTKEEIQYIKNLKDRNYKKINEYLKDF